VKPPKSNLCSKKEILKYLVYNKKCNPLLLRELNNSNDLLTLNNLEKNFLPYQGLLEVPSPSPEDLTLAFLLFTKIQPDLEWLSSQPLDFKNLNSIRDFMQTHNLDSNTQVQFWEYLRHLNPKITFIVLDFMNNC